MVPAVHDNQGDATGHLSSNPKPWVHGLHPHTWPRNGLSGYAPLLLTRKKEVTMVVKEWNLQFSIWLWARQLGCESHGRANYHGFDFVDSSWFAELKFGTRLTGERHAHIC